MKIFMKLRWLFDDDGYVLMYGAIFSATFSDVDQEFVPAEDDGCEPNPTPTVPGAEGCGPNPTPAEDDAAMATAEVDELLMLMIIGSLRPEWQASVRWCLNETNRLRVPCTS